MPDNHETSNPTIGEIAREIFASPEYKDAVQQDEVYETTMRMLGGRPKYSGMASLRVLVAELVTRLMRGHEREMAVAALGALLDTYEEGSPYRRFMAALVEAAEAGEFGTDLEANQERFDQAFDTWKDWLDAKG